MRIDNSSKETNSTPVTDAKDMVNPLLEKGSQIPCMLMLHVWKSKIVMKRGILR